MEDQYKLLHVTYPPITSYQTHAPALSIICDRKDYLPWFLFEYMRLRERRDGINYYNLTLTHKDACPFLSMKKIFADEANLLAKKNFLDFFISSLQQDYYIIPLVAVPFISKYEMPKSAKPIVHPIFIFGYNHRTSVFHAADFFQSKYKFATIPYAEMIAACEIVDYHTYEFQGALRLIKHERNPKAKEYTAMDILRQIKSYFDGNRGDALCEADVDDPWCDPDHMISAENMRFGFEVMYGRLQSEFELLKNKTPWDSRILPILCDHKKVLWMAVQHLASTNCPQLLEFVDQYKDLYIDFCILRNSTIKMVMENMYDIHSQSKIDSLKKRESKLIMQTLRYCGF